MEKLLNILEQGYNYPYSFFIFIAIGIWLISLFGLVKDFDADLHTETTSIANFAKAIGFGSIPASILITLLLFFQGTFGITLNEILLPEKKEGFIYYLALIFNFGASFGISTFFTKLLKKPLRFLFRDYGKAESNTNLIGKIAKVSTRQVSHLFGEADVILPDGNSVRVAVRTYGKEELVIFGEKVLLIEFDVEKNVYWCEKYEEL